MAENFSSKYRAAIYMEGVSKQNLATLIEFFLTTDSCCSERGRLTGDQEVVVSPPKSQPLHLQSCCKVVGCSADTTWKN